LKIGAQIGLLIRDVIKDNFFPTERDQKQEACAVN
jgi:hypothetical protein